MRPGLLASLACLACVALAACTGGPTPTSTAAPTQTVGAQPSTPAPATPVTATPTVGPSASTPLPTSTATATPADATSWTELAVAAGPAAREDHTWTVIDGVAYLFGGRTPDGPANDLWAFDLTTNAWRELHPSGPAPAPRFGHTGTAVPGIGLVVWSGQGSSGFFADIWVYDPAADAWHELPSLGAVPDARYGSCASLGPDGRLWISHGFTQDDGRFDDTRAYEFATGEWTDETPNGERPVKRCLHDCFWARNNTLILYGGQTTGIAALDDLWAYDPQAKAWTQSVEPSAAARQLYALGVASNGAAIVFGGGDIDRSYLADTWTLDASGPRLDPIDVEAAPPARSGAAMVIDFNRALLFGGKNSDGLLGDLWSFQGSRPGI